MEDSERMIAPSSPSLSLSGNNDHENENQRNSQQKNKNFMSPISAEIISPKKKILAKWKSPNLDSKSSLHKVGISNSSSSRDSLSKVPAFSSLENNMVKSVEFDNEEETFVPDSSTVPYDPLTNYLSPRPKFLRYNPNRKRKIFLSKEEKSGNSSLSQGVSFDSEISSSQGSSSKNEENLGNKQNFEHVTGEEDKEEEEEEEEEMIEEIGWGLKWVLVKGLIVFSALALCIMYISSMNSPTAYNPDHLRSNFYNSTLTLDFENIGYRNSLPYSLRNLEIGLGFYVREELEMGLSEIDEFGVDQTAGITEVQEIEIPKAIVGNFDCGQEENQVSTYPEVLPISDEAYAELARAMVKGECYHGDFPEPAVESFKEGMTENEAPMADLESDLVSQEEHVVDSEDRRYDSQPNPSDVDLASEAENAVEDSLNDMELENKGDDSFNVKLHDFKLKSVDGDSENEVEIVAEDSLNVIEQKNKGDYETEVAKSEPKFKEVQLVNEAECVAVSQVNGSSEVNIAESDKKQVSATMKDLVWFVAFTVMTCVGYLSVKVYHKCKNTFSNTSCSKKKSNFTSAGLPPKVGEKLDQIHPKPVLQVNSFPSSAMFDLGLDQIHPKPDLQVHSSSSSVMLESKEESKKTPPRIIPKVKQLGEVDFAKEFSGSVGSSAIRSGIKMQGCEDTMFVVLDDRSGKRSKVSSSSPESFSYSTNISEEKTTKHEGNKQEETTTLRRSRRIRSRTIAST